MGICTPLYCKTFVLSGTWNQTSTGSIPQTSGESQRLHGSFYPQPLPYPSFCLQDFFVSCVLWGACELLWHLRRCAGNSYIPDMIILVLWVLFVYVCLFLQSISWVIYQTRMIKYNKNKKVRKIVGNSSFFGVVEGKLSVCWTWWTYQVVCHVVLMCVIMIMIDMNML